MATLFNSGFNADTAAQQPSESMTPAGRAATVRRAQKMAYWMDDRFRIPGTQRRIGVDGLLGLIPGLGDGVSAILSAYLIGEAVRNNLPKRVITRMGWNWLVDTTVGSVPLVGDLFDFAWKSNKKNAALLARHLDAANTQNR
ncbi:MAG: DUF4112 domain-containing protein [Gammaproteobacteria bacterium]